MLRRFENLTRVTTKVVICRIIGDRIQEKNMGSSTAALESAKNEPVTLTVGSTVSAVKLDDNDEFHLKRSLNEIQCLVLHRSFSRWHRRDVMYVEKLKFDVLTTEKLSSAMIEHVRKANLQVVTGIKKKRIIERYLGFRFVRKTNIDCRRFHFDIERADEIIGELKLCTPTIYFVGVNAVDIRALMTKESLHHHYLF